MNIEANTRGWCQGKNSQKPMLYTCILANTHMRQQHCLIVVILSAESVMETVNLPQESNITKAVPLYIRIVVIV